MVLLTDFGSRVDPDIWGTPGFAYGDLAKTHRFVHSGQFSMVLLTDFGSRVDPDVWGTPGFAYGDLAKTRRFGPFWQVFYGITHRFRVPCRSGRLGNTGVRLRGPRQNSQIGSILASFPWY